MSLQDDITEAWKTAMKARDVRKDALSLIRSELKKEAINTRSEGASDTELGDEAALKVLGRMAKQRRESIVEYHKGGRDDLVQREQAELEVVQEFLPAALSEEELLAIVDEVIAETGVSSAKEMGKVMGPAMKRAGGRADGNAVRALVQKRLGE
ncbi:MAG: GatB/YqeY domain-containing protein [Candidatus Binatia bacterium]|nr:GatB/YqeY domain-containing protein [Candidatus Binatia bacterium]